jgi:HlyD family secretion protein
MVKNREAELKMSLSGSRIQEKKFAEQAVVDTQAALELSKTDAQRYQALYEKDEVSAQVRDTYSTNLKRAQASYERAKQNLDMVNEGVRKEQIAINQAGVHSARQILEMSKIKLDYTSLFAPTTGVALVRHAEVGEVMAPGTPVVTIADLDHLWLRGYISETDIGKVKLGQQVAIKSDTFPGKTYNGKISFISSQAEFTPKSVETYKERVTLVYRVKIDLDNSTHELKPGMPADAYIETVLAK